MTAAAIRAAVGATGPTFSGSPLDSVPHWNPPEPIQECGKLLSASSLRRNSCHFYPSRMKASCLFSRGAFASYSPQFQNVRYVQGSSVAPKRSRQFLNKSGSFHSSPALLGLSFPITCLIGSALLSDGSILPGECFRENIKMPEVDIPTQASLSFKDWET